MGPPPGLGPTALASGTPPQGLALTCEGQGQGQDIPVSLRNARLRRSRSWADSGHASSATHMAPLDPSL